MAYHQEPEKLFVNQSSHSTRFRGCSHPLHKTLNASDVDNAIDSTNQPTNHCHHKTIHLDNYDFNSCDADYGIIHTKTHQE